MEWRLVIVLIVSGLVVVGYVVLGLLLHRAGKKTRAAKVEAERWRGQYQEARDEVERLKSVVDNASLTADEALEKINEALGTWSAAGDAGGWTDES
jgi:hypothetical protein